MSDGKVRSYSNPQAGMPKKMSPKPPEELPYGETYLEQIEPKPAVKSKTLWGTAMIVLGIVLTILGFDSPQELLRFLEDGFQFPQDLYPLITLIGYVLKEYGHRVAVRPIQGLMQTDADKRLNGGPGDDY